MKGAGEDCRGQGEKAAPGGAECRVKIVRLSVDKKNSCDTNGLGHRGNALESE